MGICNRFRAGLGRFQRATLGGGVFQRAMKGFPSPDRGGFLARGCVAGGTML